MIIDFVNWRRSNAQPTETELDCPDCLGYGCFCPSQPDKCLGCEICEVCQGTGRRGGLDNSARTDYRGEPNGQ